jgi:molybdenum cofactor cytidylyltransferase
LKIKEEPILTCTVKKALKTSLNECIVVLGHFMNELYPSLEVITDSRLKLIENPNVDVELSQTLLNGVLNAKCDYCLCLAGDQPTVTEKTMQNLINHLLNSVNGLGMPFACHSSLLEHYLEGEEDNMNPILRKMIADGVSFYGVQGQNESELININRYDDYLNVLRLLNVKK